MNIVTHCRPGLAGCISPTLTLGNSRQTYIRDLCPPPLKMMSLMCFPKELLRRVPKNLSHQAKLQRTQLTVKIYANGQQKYVYVLYIV